MGEGQWERVVAYGDDGIWLGVEPVAGEQLAGEVDGGAGEVHHFADFAPSGINDLGMFAKLDRCTLLVWGDSFQLQEVPVRARKNEYTMTAECNMAVVQPDHNLARIARGT